VATRWAAQQGQSGSHWFACRPATLRMGGYTSIVPSLRDSPPQPIFTRPCRAGLQAVPSHRDCFVGRRLIPYYEVDMRDICQTGISRFRAPVVLSGQRRLGDIRHNYADMSAIGRLLAFAPKVPLEIICRPSGKGPPRLPQGNLDWHQRWDTLRGECWYFG